MIGSGTTVIAGVARWDAHVLRERLVRAVESCRSSIDTDVSVHEEPGVVLVAAHRRGARDPFLVEDGNVTATRGSAAAGEVALASWDRAARALTLERDHAGARPMFLREERDTVMFASDLRVPRALVSATPSARAMRHYLLFNHPLGNISWYDDVEPLAAGATTWAFHNGDAAVRTFRAASSCDEPTSASFDDALRDALLVRLPQSDVAFHNSGGVDSSLLCHLAARNGVAMQTLTATYAVQGDEELEYARRVASETGAKATETQIDADEVAQQLDSLIARSSSPLMAIGVPTFWFLARDAAHAGVTTIVSGIGGDHAFVGWNKLRGVAHRDGDATFAACMHIDDAVLTAYLAPSGARLIPRLRRELDASVPETEEQTDTIERRYRSNFLVEHLRMADLMHADWGIDLVSPFLDRDVMRGALDHAALDPDRASKGFLRRMLSRFGSAAATRVGKQQMALSLERFSDALRPRIVETLSSRSIDAIDYDRVLALASSRQPASTSELRLLWVLYNLHVWLDTIGAPAPSLLEDLQ